jgi:hypothetical protein
MSRIERVNCPVCDTTGLITCDFDEEIWEPVYDKLSGYYGWEFRSKRTGSVISKDELKPVVKECFNCEGSGYLEWEEYDE